MQLTVRGEPTKRTLILLFIIVLTRSPFHLLAEALCVRYLFPEEALCLLPPAGHSPSPVWWSYLRLEGVIFEIFWGLLVAAPLLKILRCIRMQRFSAASS